MSQNYKNNPQTHSTKAQGFLPNGNQLLMIQKELHVHLFPQSTFSCQVATYHLKSNLSVEVQLPATVGSTSNVTFVFVLQDSNSSSSMGFISSSSCLLHLFNRNSIREVNLLHLVREHLKHTKATSHISLVNYFIVLVRSTQIQNIHVTFLLWTCG